MNRQYSLNVLKAQCCLKSNEILEKNVRLPNDKIHTQKNLDSFFCLFCAFLRRIKSTWCVNFVWQHWILSMFFFAVESQTTSLYRFFPFWSKSTVVEITFTSSQVAMTTKQSNLFSKKSIKWAVCFKMCGNPPDLKWLVLFLNHLSYTCA